MAKAAPYKFATGVLNLVLSIADNLPVGSRRIQLYTYTVPAGSDPRHEAQRHCSLELIV